MIEEVGYRPHAAARQMRTRRSQVLGLRLQSNADGINGSVLDRYLHALTEQAQVRGYRIMLFTASDDDGEIGQYSELLDTLEIDGFALTATHHDDVRTRWLADHDVPFVTFGRPWSTAEESVEAPKHAWVDVNGAAGTRSAVEHLLAAGHTRIAYLGWPEGSGVGDDRRAGWRRAMAATGLPDHALDALEVGIADGVAQGARAASRLLELVAPTAFVCASDSLALGALSVTRPMIGRRSDPGGANLPAVIGFDDTPVARGVGLTSVAQPLTEAAGRSLTLLFDQVAARHDGSLPEEHPSDVHVLLNPNLVVRESSEAIH